MAEKLPQQIIAMKFNLIESTLHDQTGHGFTYAKCLGQANQAFNFTLELWADVRSKQLSLNGIAKWHGYFYRPIRRLQKAVLYFKLLRKPEVLYIGTSELLDLIFLSRLINKKTQAKIFLHFHQFKQSAKKIKKLQALARRLQTIHILTPTEKLKHIFEDAGFKSCFTLPCPTYPTNIGHRVLAAGGTDLSNIKVLYAGAARQDKGFAYVVACAAHARSLQDPMVFEIQTSPPNSQKYDNETKAALKVLENLPSDNLVIHNKTLDYSEYQRQFQNSICLLVYDAEFYEDKFSAVALDALYAGCPLVTIRNTWMGDVVEQYQAGVLVEDRTPESLYQAILTVKNSYSTYQSKAQLAGKHLASIHDPKCTLQRVVDLL